MNDGGQHDLQVHELVVALAFEQQIRACEARVKTGRFFQQSPSTSIEVTSVNAREA